MRLHSFHSDVCNVHIGYDETTAEQWAMAAAMFSRSVDGIEEISKKVTSSKSSAFMEQFYIGYGHGSIGDLADIKLFIEGVPSYVAVMLEQFSRFRGQEASTRYIDFSKQAPAYDADVEEYKKQIAIYSAAVEKVTQNLIVTNYGTAETEPTALRAIKARAFDICRSLLPWGFRTNVAWYGDIRTITQHLAYLMSDDCINRDYCNLKPYVEFIHDAIRQVYPGSTKVLEGTRPNRPFPPNYPASDLWLGWPMHPLDFGSWRDLNRHRVGKHKVRLDQRRDLGHIHPWYTNILDEHEVPYSLVMQPAPSINERLLGECVDYEYSCDREQMTYIVWRRGQDDVHPTLRNNVLDLAEQAGLKKPEGLPDPGAYGFFLRRGTQTILMKGE